MADVGDNDYQDEEMEEADNEDTIDQEEMLAARDGVDAKVRITPYFHKASPLPPPLPPNSQKYRAYFDCCQIVESLCSIYIRETDLLFKQTWTAQHWDFAQILYL